MDERELPEDIEVGRYALRTFRLNPSFDGHPHLQPLNYYGDYWKGGVCEAMCLAGDDTQVRFLIELYRESNIPLPDHLVRRALHKAPVMQCRCGIYGALSMRRLFDYGGSYMGDLVAVIAAEGSTIIGDYGLRTSAARVVAYWTRGSSWRYAMQQECGDSVKQWNNLDAMLTHYNLPWGKPPSGLGGWETLYPEKEISPVQRRRSRVIRAFDFFWCGFLTTLAIVYGTTMLDYVHQHRPGWAAFWMAMTSMMLVCATAVAKRLFKRRR